MGRGQIQRGGPHRELPPESWAGLWGYSRPGQGQPGRAWSPSDGEEEAAHAAWGPGQAREGFLEEEGGRVPGLGVDQLHGGREGD